MPGAKLRFLNSDMESWPRAERLTYGFGLVPHDNDRRRRVQRCGGTKDVLDQRQAVGLVKDLRQRRLHARALARGKDDHVEL